jgi:ABC-type dipeptide/oligopeptide/nickel transport system ATPase component
MRIGRQIAEAIRTHREVSKREAQTQAVELPRMVRIPLLECRFHKYPHQLSGGMRQRVMIAIALACRPKLLIADEATTALDITTQAQIMELLLELQQELDMALIMISHDLGLASSYANEVVVMYAGKVVEQVPAAGLFGTGGAVRMRYTRAARRGPAPGAPSARAAAHCHRAPAGPGRAAVRLRLRATMRACRRRLPGNGAGIGRTRPGPPVGLLAPCENGDAA